MISRLALRRRMHPATGCPTWLRVLMVAALISMATACSQAPPSGSPAEPASEQNRRRVLLIGIDGATLRVIDPLIREGSLPNLAAIARSGVSGALRSHYPLLSPRVWTSIATGKLPKKHGISHWVRKDGKGGFDLLQSSDRKVHALWNIVSDAGLSIGVANWLNTYPIEAIKGVMVSDASIPGERRNRELLFARKAPAQVMELPVQGTTFPDDWHTRVTRIRKESPLPFDQQNPFLDNELIPNWAYREMLANAYANDDLVARIALDIEEEINPDVLMVLMPAIDKVSHFLWGALEPASKYPKNLHFKPAQREASREALYATYKHADHLIGALVERFDSDDLVMVVSDHGFEARVLGKNQTTGGHDTGAALHGVVFARGAGIVAGAQVRGMSVNDVTPTILAWLGLPVGEDMDGRVGAFLGIDNPPTIPTHDEGEIKRAEDLPAGSEEELLEQLRALGYIEADGEPH